MEGRIRPHCHRTSPVSWRAFASSSRAYHKRTQVRSGSRAVIVLRARERRGEAKMRSDVCLWRFRDIARSRVDFIRTEVDPAARRVSMINAAPKADAACDL